MFIEKNPFLLLKSGQYAGIGNGRIVILDKSVPKEQHEYLKEEYKKWWEKRQKEMIQKDEA